MAYYNANEVIRLTRKALGMTQEQLSEGICETITLSRIENGHTSVKRNVYRQLMEKMGRLPETRYAVCIDKDGMLSEDRLELERAFLRYDYDATEYHLQRLKENADDNLLTRQYILRMSALTDYRLGKIKTEEFAQRLENALCLTVPEYEKYLENKRLYPYTLQELFILTNLSGAYRELNELNKCIELYKMVLLCLNEHYLGNPDRSRILLTVGNSLSIAYEMQGKYVNALDEIDKCIEVAVRENYGYALPSLLSAKSYNIIKGLAKKQLKSGCIEDAKNLSRQAYYIAVARGDESVVHSLNMFWDKYFAKIENE